MFAWAVLNGVIIPAVVLLFGMLPFLREGSVARRIALCQAQRLIEV